MKLCVLVVYYPNRCMEDGPDTRLGQGFLVPSETAAGLSGDLAAADISGLDIDDYFECVWAEPGEERYRKAFEAGERLFGKLSALARDGKATKTTNTGLCYLNLPPGLAIERIVNCALPEDGTF